MIRKTLMNPSAAKKIAAQSIALLLAAALALPASALPAPAVYAIKNGKIYTMAGPVIESGTVIIRDGKIAAVGANVEIPADAQVIDAAGLEVYPGLFAPVTQLGLNEIGKVSPP